MSAVNRYDSPSQDRYFNTYVPLPFEQMMPVAAARLSQLQRGQDALNKTYEDTANLEYMPGGPDEQYIKDYTGNVNNLIGKYINQDLSDPIVGGQLRSEFRKITNPQHIKDIQSSKQAWATNQKLRAARIAEGSYDEYYDKDPAAGWDTVGTGKVYDYITPGRVDEAKIADQYFNTESITKGKTLSPRGDYNMHGTTETMTNAVADENWQNFSNQPGIPRFIDKLIDQKGLDKKDPKVRQQVAQEYLRSIGKSHTWDQQTGTTLDAQVRASQEKKTPSTGNSLISHIPMPSENETDAKRSRQVYKKDIQRSSDLTTRIQEFDKLISESKNPNEIIRLKAMRNDSISEKDRIDSVMGEIKDKYLPGYTENRQKVIDDYVAKRVRKGDTKENALAALDYWENKMQGKNFRLAEIAAGSPFKSYESIKEQNEARDKFGVNTYNAALAPFEEIRKLDKQLEKQIKPEYIQDSYKFKQDIGIPMLTSGISDDITSTTTTADGIEKVPETSVLLKQFKDSGAQALEIEDISYADKSKDLMTDIQDMQKFILGADNIGMDLISPSAEADGTYKFTVTAKRSLGAGKGTVTKRFKVRVNDVVDPNTSQSWRNSLATDLAGKGKYVEADRLANNDLELKVKSMQYDDAIEVAPDDRFPTDVFKFKRNNDGTYSEVEPGTDTPVGKYNNIDLESVVQLLYSYRNRGAYEK
jgi:hypothetical protein